MLNFSYLFAAGLSDLWNNIQQNWLGPIFLGAIAIFSIVFIKDRAWMKLLAFVGIAAIVGVLIFFGADLFGAGGSLTGVAKDAAKQVQTLSLFSLMR